MKRILFLAVISTAFFNQTVQAQTFGDVVDGSAGTPLQTWTTTSAAGTTTSATPTTFILSAIGGMPGVIRETALSIQGLTLTNANDLVVTLSHNGDGAGVGALQLADGNVLTNPSDTAIPQVYTGVEVTFRNFSSPYGKEGIAPSMHSFVGADNGSSSLTQLDVFDSFDPNANWTVNISTTGLTPVSWTGITVGGFSAVAVPEPASMSLFALGMLGLGTYRRRRPRDEKEDA